jgi:hypothetical protein
VRHALVVEGGNAVIQFRTAKKHERLAALADPESPDMIRIQAIAPLRTREHDIETCRQ